ncbi:hypothetical protein [Actinokineospora sp. NPDC004072]
MGVDRQARWLVERFGGRVDLVRECIVDGLTEAQVSRQLSQEAAGIRTDHAYGGAWPAVFTKLAARFRAAADLDVRFIKPFGASYDLPVVNDAIIVPFRHATTLGEAITGAKITSKHLLDLLHSLEALTPPSPTLFDEHPELAPPSARNITRLASGMSAVLVPFVANPGSDGLLALWWGTGTVYDTGAVSWTHLDQIPLGGPKLPIPAQQATGGFAGGELPGLFAPHPAERQVAARRTHD